MAITGTDFWDQFLSLLEGGTRTSTVQYYLPNQGSGATAQAGEWGNVIDTLFSETGIGTPERVKAVELLADVGFWAPGDKLDFWINDTLAPEDIENLKAAAEERLPNLFDAEGTATKQPSGQTAVGTPRGVMSGGDLVKVERPDGTSYFAIRYNKDGIEHLYSFGSEAVARQAIGNLDNAVVMQDSDVNDGDTWLLGDAVGFVGQEGNYNVYFDDLMGEAALEAGIRNPGMLGRYASDPDIMRILAQGEAGDWGIDRIQAEIRNTSFYLETLYPGIDKILEQGIGDPETAWKQYNNSVEGTLTALGYARDDDGSYRSKIGEMLTLGIEDEAFVEASKTFIKAEQSPQFRAILNQWTNQEIGKDASFDEWFDVLAGTSTPEFEAIVEKATIQFQAEQSQLFLDPTQVARIAELTQLSEQAVGTAFSSVEQQLLALGDVGLARYSLSVQKLIDSTLNIGESPAETRRLAAKTIRELGLADDDKAQFFTGFSQRGAPQKTGLLAGAPEAG